MGDNDETIRALREALVDSPGNLPLRRHLASTLAALGRLEEAKGEYKEALALKPDDDAARIGLANVYFRLGENATASVIVEQLLNRAAPAADVIMLHARLLLSAGDVDAAAREYRRAVGVDGRAADPVLAQQLEVPVSSDGEDDGDGTDHPCMENDRIAVPAEAGLERFDVALERPSISFADVGGMEALKEEIRLKIVHPLSHPELYRAYGKPIGGGVLLFGPPGCGKTYLARATAGEVKATFLAVEINDILDMWLGKSERNLHEVFEMARRNAPCVLFVDEVDALGASRTDLRFSAGRTLINQFLSELDGVKSPNEGVLILGATNAPWHLDPAFRRPGRFDRILFVPPPDTAARAEILKIILAGKPKAEIDLASVARRTEGFSGADLKALVDVAVEAKLRKAMKKGVPLPLTNSDLLSAARVRTPSTREWFATARNYALYANQGGAYNDIIAWLGHP